MMKRIIAGLIGLLSLSLPSAALAQCSGIFTAGYFCGNSAAGGGLAGAASPTAMFDRAFGGTNNSTVVRLGGVWTVLSSANSGVWITSVAGVPSISSTLPNAVQDNITRLGTIANIGAPLGATFGGTAQLSWAQGDILYASAVNTLAKLAAAATGNALLSGTAPSWGKIGLTTHVSGQLPLANGGCNGTTAATCLNNIMPTPTRAGDIAYWNGSAWVSIAGNNSGTNVLTENSSGVPSWSAPGTGTVTSAGLANTYGLSISGSPITTSGNISAGVSLSTASNCTGDIAVANGSYTDGPSMAQGTSGTWDVRSTITFLDTNVTANNLACKLWDGTTLISSSSTVRIVASGYTSFTLVGRLASPAANIKVSCKALNATTTLKGADSDGNANATCIWGTRVQ